MWALPSAGGWHLDAFSSFIVLVGEHRELEYRRSQHRWSSLLSFPAPVAGLQSYLHANTKIIDRTGMEYISPYNSNKANLRNIRIEAIINYYGLLRDGNYYKLSIPAIDPQAKIRFPNSAWRRAKWPKFTPLAMGLYIPFCWGVCATLFWGMVHCPKTTWIGNSLCFSLGAWSFILRLIDLYCIVPGKTDESPGADSDDAVIFLGRRNSCVVLEGLRKDISSWTGRGLTERDNPQVVFVLTWFRRLGTLGLLLFIFATIPHGTLADQVGFIIFNGIGQVNLLACNHISMKRYNDFLYQDYNSDHSNVRTRTHVYGKLITYFQNRTKDPDWVEKVKLFPDTQVWKLWKARTLQGDLTDAKQLWDTCRDEIRDQEHRDLEDEERRVRCADEAARVVVEDAEHEKVEARVALSTLETAANTSYQAKRDARLRLRRAEAVFNELESAKIEKGRAQAELDSFSNGPNTIATRIAANEARARLHNAKKIFDRLVSPRNNNQQEEMEDVEDKQQQQQDRRTPRNDESQRNGENNNN